MSGCTIDGAITPGVPNCNEFQYEQYFLAVSGVAKKYDVQPEETKILETKYHSDAGDWYVALGWDEKKAIIQMDSVLGTITEIKEI